MYKDEEIMHAIEKKCFTHFYQILEKIILLKKKYVYTYYSSIAPFYKILDLPLKD